MQRGCLAGIHTAPARQPQLLRVAQQANVSVADAAPLRKAATAHIPGDWLVSINSAVILSPETISAYPGGVINLHNGPLPEYAGRHVTQWGIRNGEKVFAATVHYVEADVDAGDIIAAEPFEIRPEDTGLSVFNKSFKVGTKLILTVIDDILVGRKLPRNPQDLSKRKLFRHSDALDGRINWKWNPRQIVDFIRAGNYLPLRSPSHTATIDLSRGRVEVFRAVAEEVSASRQHHSYGTIVDVAASGPLVTCCGGAVRLTDARCEGRVLDRDKWIAIRASIASDGLPGRCVSRLESDGA